MKIGQRENGGFTPEPAAKSTCRPLNNCHMLTQNVPRRDLNLGNPTLTTRALLPDLQWQALNRCITGLPLILCSYSYSILRSLPPSKPNAFLCLLLVNAIFPQGREIISSGAAEVEKVTCREHRFTELTFFKESNLHFHH